MGNQATKSARTPPARYVAKQLPRPVREVEDEFKKAQHTIQGINKAKEHVNTTPQPYVETKLSDESTETLDMTAPKWYVNSMLDMMDNSRTGVIMSCGNFPLAWEKDKFEPYALVRNRIDDEDSDWLLSPEIKNQPIEVLLEHTKLEREVLEDILATVEVPRVQYRNYQGKLHKAVEDQNSFLTERKAQVEEAREDELLRDIGYTDEEIDGDKQYRTNRPRGVKTLDDLGVSLHSKKRMDRAKQHTDMQSLLDQRKMDSIESGTYEPTEEDLGRDPDQLSFIAKGTHTVKINKEKRMYEFDAGGNPHAMSRMNWWRNRRKSITPHKDLIHDAPVYNETLSRSEAQAAQELKDATEMSKQQAQQQGAKGWHDPKDDYNAMLQAMRENQEREAKVSSMREDIDATIKSDGPKRPVSSNEWSKKSEWSSKLPTGRKHFGAVDAPPYDPDSDVGYGRDNKKKDK